ncbi:hypothetical protein BGZ65_012182, partial [Modicella reniformis]
ANTDAVGKRMFLTSSKHVNKVKRMIQIALALESTHIKSLNLLLSQARMTSLRTAMRITAAAAAPANDEDEDDEYGGGGGKGDSNKFFRTLLTNLCNGMVPRQGCAQEVINVATRYYQQYPTQ